MDYKATAKFIRPGDLPGCMQNFDIFRYDDKAYLLASKYKKDLSGVENIGLSLSVYDSSKKTFIQVGKPIYNVCPGHGNSVDVVSHNGKLYFLHVIGTNKKIEGVGCRELIIESDSWRLGDVTAMTPAMEYGDELLFTTMVAVSDSYVCICNSYGTSLRNDKERYVVYAKKQFMDLITQGNCKQNSMHNLRVATGTFHNDNSLGLNISKEAAVLQCIALGEDSDKPGRLNIFATVDDRRIGNKIGRMMSQINRVPIQIEKIGSDSAKKTQNLSKAKCYYSPIDLIEYEGVTVSMNCVPGLGNEEKRFELEGIKKVSGVSDLGIPNGWYINVFNSDKKGTPADMPTEDVDSLPWNYMIFKPQTTPVIYWDED